MHNDRQNLGMKNNNNKQDWQIINDKQKKTNKNKTETQNVTNANELINTNGCQLGFLTNILAH